MIDPNCALAWRSLALAHALNSQPAEAIRAVDRSIALEPSSDKAWVLKAVAYADLSKFAEAKRCADQALALNPNNKDVLELKDQLNKAHRSKNLSTGARVGGGVLKIWWTIVSEMTKAVFKGL